jgi:PII-like signaling protein
LINRKYGTGEEKKTKNKIFFKLRSFIPIVKKYREKKEEVKQLTKKVDESLEKISNKNDEIIFLKSKIGELIKKVEI